MSSTPNTKHLQPVSGTDDAVAKLARNNYYKYRAANLMFGFNTNVTKGLNGFAEFNALRKGQLLGCLAELGPLVRGAVLGNTAMTASQYRDYYFMPQFEVGQPELVDVHHYTYAIDACARALDSGDGPDGALAARVHAVNQALLLKTLWSTSRRDNYDKLLSREEFERNARKLHAFFQTAFMSVEFFKEVCALGFSEINPKEKDVNTLTQSCFYTVDLMQRQSMRMEYEFEKECINEMARSTLRKHLGRFNERQSAANPYEATIRVGAGYTYSKYNTLMHFLSVVDGYWRNPDLNSIQVFGKDVRALIATSCQKVFFADSAAKNHGGYFHYGPIEVPGSYQYGLDLDLAVASSRGSAVPSVSRDQRDAVQLVVTDRVFEHGYLKAIVAALFEGKAGVGKLLSDNLVLNLTLLSLLLDFGLFEAHGHLLNLPSLESLKRSCDPKPLQVEVANLIFESDKRRGEDSVTRSKVEALLFECGYKFLVNKGFPVQSRQFELIRELNADPAYHPYVLLVKVYMSLCNINKSAEVDYYKLKCNGEFSIVIPEKHSKSTGEYLDVVTKRYTFSERDGFIRYADVPLFDVRVPQPAIDLFKVRFDSASPVASMVKYIEVANVFRSAESETSFLMFIADNVLRLEVDPAADGKVSIKINGIGVEVATVFFNKAISFVPCFRYDDTEDVIFFASKNIHYLVDSGGQFCTDYYGMRHELMECIKSDEVLLDLNDEQVFKQMKLSELLTESKTVLYAPDYLLQVPSRQQLINLLDLSIYVRNVSFFILVLFYLERCSVALLYTHKEDRTAKITGPWLAAIKYVLGFEKNAHYEALFREQFVDLDQHADLPLPTFVDALCENFCKYQRQIDGAYQIVPTAKQKAFLQRIIMAEESFHFSEVGSGKTKVILPLLCQAFLSNNAATHKFLARGGKDKNILVVLVPEHLVPDAKAQVFRYCLNLNFRSNYKIYDDIFALLHPEVQLDSGSVGKRPYGSGAAKSAPQTKQIYVTSFNAFKKALTNDVICAKVWPARKRILVVADEVDDFLDRDKLVFNICSNKGSAFDRPTLERYFEVSAAAYARLTACPPVALEGSPNPAYWSDLFLKFGAIHGEIQDASKSINKSFGIFNEATLRHCTTNITHDVEGYKSLIARPYESVNRAMPGSYYSDVERTIFLTYVILVEDIAKYDELFQQERKFISFEYWTGHVQGLDYDDLVYGHDSLSEVVKKHPSTKGGLVRYLYEIILRRMEIRDKSRSVNSIDVVFNFDCIGFTGTPFIDNYPTFAYIQSHRADEIPSLIDRSFYAYSSEQLPEADFLARFARFQGTNSDVRVEYVASDALVSTAPDELSILKRIFQREQSTALDVAAAGDAASIPGAPRSPGSGGSAFGGGTEFGGGDAFSLGDAVLDAGAKACSGGVRGVALASHLSSVTAPASPPAPPALRSSSSPAPVPASTKKKSPTAASRTLGAASLRADCGSEWGWSAPCFNVLVDLCGVFKRSTIHQVRDLVKAQFGPDAFHYVYHIDQADGGDRVLAMGSDNDVQFDEEFFKHLCKAYGAGLRDKVFFFVDNRNVIGKDVPFQLVYRRRFGQPLFTKSVVLAHDVDDFSKIWQAMGRSRTMNDTCFAIYKSGIAEGDAGGGVRDIKAQELTRELYVRNCDLKAAGNLSSNYQALIALANHAEERFYHRDSIVNTFLDKLGMTIGRKVNDLEEQLVSLVLDTPRTARILGHMLAGKFGRASHPVVAGADLTPELVEELVRQIVQHKYEQRPPSGDEFDEYIRFLSGEQSLMEISYTKQQQKQKTKTANKNQDSDMMDVFRKENQLHLELKMDNYFAYTQDPSKDLLKAYLALPLPVPILEVTYKLPGDGGGARRCLRVYPTLQFLYSHHVQAGYITPEVRKALKSFQNGDSRDYAGRFLATVAAAAKGPVPAATIDRGAADASSSGARALGLEVATNWVRVAPAYTLAALSEGVYVIGMKEQFNAHDLASHPLSASVAYVADDAGFILYDRTEPATAAAVAAGGAAASGAAVGSLDAFGPYFVEQYMIMEVLSKHEVAQNVLDYYCGARGKLERGLATYSEAQGKGFVCWRFLLRETLQPGGGGGAAGEAADGVASEAEASEAEGDVAEEGGGAAAPSEKALGSARLAASPMSDDPSSDLGGPKADAEAEAEAEIEDIFAGAR